MCAARSGSYALDTTWRTLFKDLGIAPSNVLRRAGLPDDLLAQPSVRLDPETYHRLWAGIEAESGDPLLPLRLCEVIRAESFSPPLFAALCSPNLRVAVRRIAHYKALIAPMRLDVIEANDAFTVAFAWVDGRSPPPVSLVVTELLFCVLLARMGTREPLCPVEVATPVPPSPRAPYQAFLGVSIARGARHQVTFTKADASRPFLTSSEALWDLFEPGLRTRLADLEAGVTTAERVRAALLEALPSGQVAMEAVAGRLSLSKRTLQRRIEAEGTSYQQVLKEVRTALAWHYLRNGTLPMSEISFLLGFDEPNSFHRAFRAWTGLTPDNARHLQ